MENRVFTTSNLALAAFLIVRGLHFIECASIGPDRCTFRLSDPDSRGPELQREYHRDAPCPIKSYVNSTRELRTALNVALGVAR